MAKHKKFDSNRRDFLGATAQGAISAGIMSSLWLPSAQATESANATSKEPHSTAGRAKSVSKSPFNGEWKLDRSRSKNWDWKNNKWIPDQLDREDIRIYIDGDVYDWDLWAGKDPAYHLTHSTIIDGDWTPYMCRAIVMSDEAKAKRNEQRSAEASKINLPTFEVNKPTAFVKVVRINERFLLRISRHPDGRTPNYILTTEVTENDELQGYLMTPSGVVATYRIMTRVS